MILSYTAFRQAVTINNRLDVFGDLGKKGKGVNPPYFSLSM